jgi:multidrug efflux pump subunit AcrA (membrane-fusion protein)
MRLADEAASLGVRPGMRAEASLATRLPGETVAIDPSALVSRPDGTPVVYVVEDGTVREVPVELQRAAEERLLARAPLAPGTMVVVSGQKSLIDGEHVEVVKR